MPVYEFGCAACGRFDRSFAMTDVPDATACPQCRSDARRLMSAGRLSRGASRAMRLWDDTKRSASEPAVVSTVPGRGAPRPVTTNPLHRKLPRP